jgi:hypothetical protein
MVQRAPFGKRRIATAQATRTPQVIIAVSKLMGSGAGGGGGKSDKKTK